MTNHNLEVCQAIISSIADRKLNDAQDMLESTMNNKISDALVERRDIVALELGQNINEEDSDYDTFFKKAMKKFNISSPGDLKSEEEKKKFFSYVDKNFKSKNEETELDEGTPNKLNEAMVTSTGKNISYKDGPYTGEVIKKGKIVRTETDLEFNELAKFIEDYANYGRKVNIKDNKGRTVHNESVLDEEVTPSNPTSVQVGFEGQRDGVLNAMGSNNPDDLNLFDYNGDGVIDFDDLLIVLSMESAGEDPMYAFQYREDGRDPTTSGSGKKSTPNISGVGGKRPTMPSNPTIGGSPTMTGQPSLVDPIQAMGGRG
tara:strand:+ start:287 stop:1234 length:948 start_codon:yes stop_codon:yes gene_type:complete